MSKFFTIASFVTLAILVFVLSHGRIDPASSAQAAQMAPVASPAPAPVGQSGTLYVVNHGAWG